MRRLNPFLHNHQLCGDARPDMRVLWWHELGFAAYGQVLVAGAELTQRSPELLRKFVAVTQRAWAQCLAQPVPCVDALLAETSALDGAREQAVWELVAQIYRLDPAAAGPLAPSTRRELPVRWPSWTPPSVSDQRRRRHRQRLPRSGDSRTALKSRCSVAGHVKSFLRCFSGLLRRQPEPARFLLQQQSCL